MKYFFFLYEFGLKSRLLHFENFLYLDTMLYNSQINFSFILLGNVRSKLPLIYMQHFIDKDDSIWTFCKTIQSSCLKAVFASIC